MSSRDCMNMAEGFFFAFLSSFTKAIFIIYRKHIIEQRLYKEQKGTHSTASVKAAIKPKTHNLKDVRLRSCQSLVGWAVRGERGNLVYVVVNAFSLSIEMQPYNRFNHCNIQRLLKRFFFVLAAMAATAHRAAITVSAVTLKHSKPHYQPDSHAAPSESLWKSNNPARRRETQPETEWNEQAQAVQLSPDEKALMQLVEKKLFVVVCFFWILLSKVNFSAPALGAWRPWEFQSRRFKLRRQTASNIIYSYYLLSTES